MVLGLRGPGRVGRRRFFIAEPPRVAALCVEGPRRRAPRRLWEAWRAAPRLSDRPEAARGRWSSWRRCDGACPAGLPVLPDQAPAGGGSVSSCRVMEYRRETDLRAGWGRSRPPFHARVTTEWPAVRVLARGGGGDRRVPDGRLRPCLAQRRERCSRVDGLAHQLAERALERAACGRRGEHVFGRLRTRSDGTRTLRDCASEATEIWLWRVHSGLRSCKRSCRTAGGAAARPSGFSACRARPRRRPWCAPCRPPPR
jgi:hypothetical protein